MSSKWSEAFEHEEDAMTGTLIVIVQVHSPYNSSERYKVDVESAGKTYRTSDYAQFIR